MFFCEKYYISPPSNVVTTTIFSTPSSKWAEPVFIDTASADTEIPFPAPIFKVAVPVKAPPVKPLPAITAVISPLPPPAPPNPLNSAHDT